MGENIPISEKIDRVIKQNPNPMVIATVYHVAGTNSKMEKVLKNGIHVIGPAEEMAYPKASALELSERIGN